MPAKVTYLTGGQHGLQQVLIITDGDKIAVPDLVGSILQKAAGILDVGAGGVRPRRLRCSANDDDWAFRVGDQMMADRAEQHPGKAAVPPRSDH